MKYINESGYNNDNDNMLYINDSSYNNDDDICSIFMIVVIIMIMVYM